MCAAAAAAERGQYVTREPTLAEWRLVLEGVFTFPDFPKREGIAAYMTCYFESYEGAGRRERCRGRERLARTQRRLAGTARSAHHLPAPTPAMLRHCRAAAAPQSRWSAPPARVRRQDDERAVGL